MKTILIQNFHIANTLAIIKDFKALGYRIVMPKDNWNGRLKYYFENYDYMEGDKLTYEEFMALPAGDILVACYEQQDDFEAIAKEHGDRLILHTAGNNVPYRHGISQHLISPDIQTYNNYPAQYKMLYWFPPFLVVDTDKDLDKSFESNLICGYVHFYQQYWPDSWNNAKRFEQLYGEKVYLYGYENPDGALDLKGTQNRMKESKFTLYFKEKDCYGNAVLESMALGTPVIAMRRYIHDKTLGMFFLNDENSIIVDSPEEALQKIKLVSRAKYEEMSKNAVETIAKLTDNEKRLQQMKEVLLLN